MPRGGSSGRIRPHERDTNDDAPILGADVPVSAVHKESVRSTELKQKEEGMRRNYRNRIKDVYSFFKEKYPLYYAVGVREVTDQELADPDKFYWKNKHDLIYEGLNVQMVKAFLAEKKVKPNGKMSSHVHCRKYHDAILYGAQEAGESLPRLYYEEIEKYLSSFLKETVQAKKEGNLDEQEADPITWALFKCILPGL